MAEWLTFKGYFVRTSVAVGPRDRGGFEGELDVIALNPGTSHLLHVECSLDGWSWQERERKFSTKFQCGRRHVPGLFKGFTLPTQPDQAVVLMFAGTDRRKIGDGRRVRATELVAEIINDLSGTTLRSGIVPDVFPLVRTIQLAAAGIRDKSVGNFRLVPDTAVTFPPSEYHSCPSGVP
ncbi:MAG: hypothetical protein WAN86_19070 [Hyphomicrobiaceae bacterium]